MAERQVDMAAVSRVSRRVELLDVRLESLAASGHPNQAGQALEPEYSDACVPSLNDAGRIELSCGYKFKAMSAGTEVAQASFIYILAYRVVGDEQPSKDDVAQFALANGPFHSWPFARELIYSVTARMGFPPFVLPVLTIKPKTPAQPAEARPEASAEPARASTE